MTSPDGIIDLSTLRKPAGSGTGASAADAVTEANLDELLAGSARTATILIVTSGQSPQAMSYTDTMRRLIAARGGALRLGVVDAQAQPRVAAALRAQAIPATFLLIHGQIQPMFEGALGEQDIEGVLDQVQQIAAQQGLQAGEDTAGDAAEQAQEELSPQAREAQEALESGNLDRAEEIYAEMLRSDPSDAAARSAVAMVRLLRRTRGADLESTRRAAADAPGDLDAQMAVADMDLLGGHVEDALARLLTCMRQADREDRPQVRDRMLEVFDLVGPDDPRVGTARRRMASLLY